MDTKGTTRTTQEQFIDIRDLQPYSIYNYEIRAHTEGGTSAADSYNVTTKSGRIRQYFDTV